MAKATKTWFLAVLLLFVSISVAVVPGIVSASMAEQIRAIGVVVLPVAIGVPLVFVYFRWRTRWVNRFRAQLSEH